MLLFQLKIIIYILSFLKKKIMYHLDLIYLNIIYKNTVNSKHMIKYKLKKKVLFEIYRFNYNAIVGNRLLMFKLQSIKKLR